MDNTSSITTRDCHGQAFLALLMNMLLMSYVNLKFMVCIMSSNVICFIINSHLIIEPVCEKKNKSNGIFEKKIKIEI